MATSELVPITLPTIEFMRRWCPHILPKGYTKTRSFGDWHNRRRDAYLERCAILLEAVDAPLPEDALEFNVWLDPSPGEQESELQRIAGFPRNSANSKPLTSLARGYRPQPPG